MTSDSSKKLAQPRPQPVRVWLRWLIALLVLAGLAATIAQAAGQFSQQPIAIDQIDATALLLAAVFYVLGLTTAGSFWFLILRQFGQPVSASKALRAFFLSQLGKYVPGKAMVIVIRAASIRSHGSSTSVAAIATFIETLTWIAVGAALGLAMIVSQYAIGTAVTTIAVAAFLAAAIPLTPPIFRMIVHGVGVARRWPAIGAAVGGYSWRLAMAGWCAMSTSWLFNATSLWWVVSSIPETTVSEYDLWLMLTAVTLATVVGFVSMMPGGLGARELVIIPVLGGQFGVVAAVAAALLMRAVSLTTELAIVITILVVQSLRKSKNASASNNEGLHGN